MPALLEVKLRTGKVCILTSWLGNQHQGALDLFSHWIRDVKSLNSSADLYSGEGSINRALTVVDRADLLVQIT